MSTVRTLKKLLLGETWILPVGIATVITCCGLLIEPLAPGTWPHLGGLVLAAGVTVV